ncbi:hypothetical protein BGZ46_009532 [Entomortierella lignicola]|nr:hypothetical protein BGZ46_009532 [Entomortierella lignicola]
MAHQQPNLGQHSGHHDNHHDNQSMQDVLQKFPQEQHENPLIQEQPQAHVNVQEDRGIPNVARHIPGDSIEACLGRLEINLQCHKMRCKYLKEWKSAHSAGEWSRRVVLSGISGRNGSTVLENNLPFGG